MEDSDYMRHALACAQEAQGSTGDNPSVGCVVVAHEKQEHHGATSANLPLEPRPAAIVGWGATRPQGGDHAEVVAIRLAEAKGVDIRSCAIYVTLEPCTFYGRTPPCCQLLVAKAPRRVIIGILDPHPLVRGRGIAQLEAHGIPVRSGVLADEIRIQLASWLQRHPPL